MENDRNIYIERERVRDKENRWKGKRHSTEKVTKYREGRKIVRVTHSERKKYLEVKKGTFYHGHAV